jgi:NHLM bacteriocin system ABC transporter ATP-binding protein
MPLQAMEHDGSPLPLDDPDHAWLVVEGSVDIFAVPRLAEGYAPRRYLWSAGKGDLIPPVPPPPEARLVLTAVGHGSTRLRALPVSALADVAHAAALDRVVASLAPLLASPDRVAMHEVLTPGAQFVLPRGKHASVRERTIWIRHIEGSTQIGGRSWMELTPRHGWVPIHGLWIAAANDVRLETRDTASHLRAGGDVSGLAVLIALMQSGLSGALDIDDMQMTHRLHAKAASDRRMWRHALGNLASVLESEVPAVNAPVVREPVMAACRAIGAVAGIEFRDPPRWEARRASDLLPAICRVSRVRSRRVALRDLWWRSDAGPLLGYRKEDSTPVALFPEGGGSYVLEDPRNGGRQLVTPEVAAELQPFAVTFYRPLPDDARSVRDLVSFIAPVVRSDLAGIAFAALAGGLLALAIPLATAHLFNLVIPNARSVDFITLLVALSATAIGSALFDITRAFALTRTEGRISAALQTALVDRLFSLPVPFFRRYAVGDLSQRAAAIQSVQEVIGTSTLTAVLTSAFSAVNLLILFYYEWRLALMATGLILVSGTVNGLLIRESLRHERLQQEANARVSGLVFQMIAGIARLRVSASERRAFAVWSAAFSKQRAEAQRAGSFKAAINVFNDVLPVLCTALLFGMGGWLLFGKGESFRTGDFVAFSAAFGTLFAAVVALSNAAIGIVSAAAVMEKAAPILETAPEVTETKNDPGALTGLIEGVHLTFRYHADGPLVLDDVSFRAEPGQFVAFVGPSGSGKSTMLRLLLGFESPGTGAVYYDGQDLASVDISAIRNHQLGAVLQSSRLLGGDIFTNIIGSSSSLTLDDAWEAAEAAGLADDIRAMPMEMHTLLSESGTSTFSGGQRQRLLIARALVRKPRIILFDEATSALDNRTQAVVTRTLELSSATRFVIAHRLSTIRKADRIFVMNRGKIVEEGAFDELAGAGGLFSQLIARQYA